MAALRAGMMVSSLADQSVESVVMPGMLAHTPSCKNHLRISDFSSSSIPLLLLTRRNQHPRVLKWTARAFEWRCSAIRNIKFGRSMDALPAGFHSSSERPFSLSQLHSVVSTIPAVSSLENFRNLNLVVRAGRDSVSVPDRIISAIGYLLPFFDGIQYGRYFFLQYPAAETLLRPFFPLLQAYKSFPYSNFIAFFALYLLVVRNQQFSRYVRFNTMQAVVLDVLLILPTLVERTFSPRGGIGFDLLIIFYNTVFLFLVACFGFGVISCILGKTPRLPVVADAADAQV